MPKYTSAQKRDRTSMEKQSRNRAVKSLVRTARRKLLESFQRNDKTECQALYQAYCSTLDKAVKKGVIKKNTAIRRKARAAEKLRGIAVAAS